MKASIPFRIVSNFLFSKANRELLIFLFFFAIAGIFWLLMTLNESYEQEIRIPIRYTNVPRIAVLTSPETDTIRVTIRDKGITLLTYLYGDAFKTIDIDFNSHIRQNGRGEVLASELSKKVALQLGASSKLISTKPDRLTFYYNFGEKKRVSVKYRGTVIPEDPYFISSVAYEPDSITIYASREKLDSIGTVFTKALNYQQIRDTLTVKASLTKIPGVKMVPENVSIQFMTDILTEESFDGIPVTCINLPPGKILRMFPAKVSVQFVTGIKTFKTLSPTDFQIVADYEEIKENPSPKCNIYLRKVPNGISKVKLNYKQLDYLIEEQN